MASQLNNNILEINDLSVDFESDNEILTAADSISFSLQKGKTLGLVGESGSGKSVTALAVMRLLQIPPAKITRGSVILRTGNNEQIDLLSLGKKEMQKIRGDRISMVFQEPMTSLNPVMRCGTQVVETIRTHRKISTKEAREKTIELFQEVRLPRPEEIFRAYPHEISGGQKQRVTIAMAIASNPDVLIADEPTTALDVTVQKTILSLLRELQQKSGMAILFITHDLGIISEIADDVIVMNKGRIVESGSVRKIFSAAEHPYTKGLMACRPSLRTRLRRLPTIKDFMDNESAFDISKLQLDEQEYQEDLKKKYSSESLMEVNRLKKWFPLSAGFLKRKRKYVKAVDDVSLKIYPGEVLGLVGESGCGKTTLGRAILRLTEPDEGTIRFRDLQLERMPAGKLRKQRKHLQIVFQDPFSSLNPRITIGHAIMEPMVVHHLYKNNKERREKVMELLEKVGLERSHFRRYPHEFSGGQRQRICIARALAVHPDVIICDEAVSALDVSVQAQVLNLLNDLKKEFGFTYIFISHDLSVVNFMSDRILVMKEGKIEEEGFADEIYHSPKSEYTKRLIRDSISGEMESLPT